MAITKKFVLLYCRSGKWPGEFQLSWAPSTIKSCQKCAWAPSTGH